MNDRVSNGVVTDRWQDDFSSIETTGYAQNSDGVFVEIVELTG